MTRKRDTLPEALLQLVIEEIETSEEPSSGGKVQPDTPAYERLRASTLRGALVTYRGAMLALLGGGPLLCTPTEEPDDATILLVRAELIALLRQAVRLRESGHAGYGIALLAPPQFSLRLDGHRALVGATGSFRDLVVLQLVWLLEHVGLAHVRQCAAPDCSHLYVKSYRKEFCSRRCERRTSKRRERHAAREKHEQHLRTRRRRAMKGRG